MFKRLKLLKRYNESIAFRYLSIAGICLGVLQLTFGASQSHRIYQQKAENLEEKVQGKLLILSKLVPEAMIRYDSASLEKVLKANNQDKDIIYGVIFDKDFKTIAYAITTNEPIVNKLTQRKDITGSSQTISLLKSHKSIIEVSKTVQLGDYKLGEVKIGYSLKSARKELIKATIHNIYSALLISGLFIILTIIIFKQQILYPIQKLQQLAEEFAAGKLDSRVEVEREDELGTLSSALNSMTLQIKHTLKNLEKAIDDALIAEKAKSKFLAKMSHELKTPLNGIIGFTQIMQQESTTTIEQQENLGIIEQNSLHLLNLINDVLEITCIESGQTFVNYNSFDLFDLLNSLKQMLAFKAKEKNIKLSFKIDHNVPQHIESDEDKIRQIVFNLLDNSVKFTNTGKIGLTVKYKPDEEEDFIQNLYFKIEDTGIGISSTEIDNLFVAFAQTETGERYSQGMGLGLPLTRQLLQLMGGDISIKSEVNQGTVVRFFIPVTEADMNQVIFQGHYSDSQSLEGDFDSIDSQFFYQPSSSYNVAGETLNAMPEGWLEELLDATMKVDNDRILELLEEIPDDNQVLHQAIIDLIDNFRYDSILELVEVALDR